MGRPSTCFFATMMLRAWIAQRSSYGYVCLFQAPMENQRNNQIREKIGLTSKKIGKNGWTKTRDLEIQETTQKKMEAAKNEFRHVAKTSGKLRICKNLEKTRKHRNQQENMEVAKNEVRNVAKNSGKLRYRRNHRKTIGNSWEKLGNNLENIGKPMGKTQDKLGNIGGCFCPPKFSFFWRSIRFFSYCLLFCKFPGCACNSSIIIRELPETQRASLMQNCFSYCS